MHRTLLLLAALAALPALALDVEGYVYTDYGTPVADAAVIAGGQNKPTTDAEGHFKLTGFGEQIVTLEVRAGEETERVFALAGDPPVTVTLGAGRPVPPARQTGGAHSISGVVRVGKKPLPGAPVLIQPLDGADSFRVTADDKGRFQAAVPPGRYAVTEDERLEPRFRSVHAMRTYEQGKEPFFANVTREKSATVEVEVIAAPLLTGRVVDHEGKPVARAAVLVILAEQPALFAQFPLVRTLPNGRFAIPAPPLSGPAQFLVSVPGHSTVRSKPFDVAAAKPMDIALPRFLEVKLRVVDAEGKPIPRATVAWTDSSDLPDASEPDALLRSPQRFMTESGELALRLAGGEYTFVVTADSFQQATITRAVDRAATIDLPLERGYAITGRIHRGKSGVAGVRVTVSDRPRHDVTVETAADGTFTLDSLPRGGHSLDLWKGEEMIERTVSAEAPGTIDVELPPAGMLRGTVVDVATRKPVTGFVYTITGSAEAGEPRSATGGSSGEDGAFVATVPIGTYRVAVAASGYLPGDPVEARVTERTPAEIVIALDRGATVIGRVTDESGAPIEGATVLIVRDERNLARSALRIGPSRAETDAAENFTLEGIVPGPATLVARSRGYLLVQKPLDVQATARADITLTRGITITGTVTAGGRPAGGVRVTATTPASGVDTQSALTDSGGRFAIPGLVPARYTLSATSETRTVQVANVDVASRREIAIELEGQPPGTIYGTVTGISRLAGKITSRVVTVDGDGDGATGRIDDAGNYRIEDAPAGPVDVFVTIETTEASLSSSRRRVEVLPREAVRVDLDLGGTIAVRGRVTHEGRPIAGARVSFSSPEASVVSTSTRSDGTYELTLVHPGVYLIFATSEDETQFQTFREIRASETVDIAIREQRIEGTVIDAETRQPIVRANVSLKNEAAAILGNVTGMTFTDAAGRFTLTTAASGSHSLVVSAPGYAHRIQPVTLGETRPPQYTFELGRGGELRVRVLDARTRIPLEARLVLIDQRGMILPIREGRSPDEFPYIFWLAPGRYRLTAIVQGYGRKTVDVTSPGTVEIALE